MRKPGRIILLPDSRRAIAYNKQPLLKSHSKIVLCLIDEKGTETGKTLLKDSETYNWEVQTEQIKLIGFID